MPQWVDMAWRDYDRRMPREAALKLIEIRAEPRGAGASAAAAQRAMEAEADRIGAAVLPGSVKVMLDERGRAWTTRELAQRLADWQMGGRNAVFVIGGPDGLAAGLKSTADFLWSLSPLTLPHGLVRVILAEQLYRATTILKNHPYHRD
jgi:23S rRNA (pseudouridine1915-N3)-methyltransferase